MKENKLSGKKKPILPPIDKDSVYAEAALPFLLILVCLSVTLIAAVIDRFIYPFGNELLSPIILQVVVILLPCYLMILIISPDRRAGAQRHSIGFGKLHVEYIFFIIFSAMFMMCTSLVLSMLFGGTYSSAEGYTLLGVFTAGQNEYTTSIPYLLITYVILPAISEELLFRGIIYSQLKKINAPLAVAVSSVISAVFCFSIGGLVPALFSALALTFVLYTTGSLAACIIVHLIFNLYKLFLETNISAYFLSAQNRVLLILTVVIAFLISSLLFFSECSKIYRARAAAVTQENQNKTSLKTTLRELWRDVRLTLSFRPTLVCAIISLIIYVAMLIIGLVT